MRVLTLSPNYEPIGTISWKKAVALVFLNKVHTLEEYDEEIRSASFKMKIPSVVVLKTSKWKRINSVRFSRKNVWIRDEGKCQYCFKNVNINEPVILYITSSCFIAHKHILDTTIAPFNINNHNTNNTPIFIIL